MPILILPTRRCLVCIDRRPGRSRFRIAAVVVQGARISLPLNDDDSGLLQTASGLPTASKERSHTPNSSSPRRPPTLGKTNITTYTLQHSTIFVIDLLGVHTPQCFAHAENRQESAKSVAWLTPRVYFDGLNYAQRFVAPHRRYEPGWAKQRNTPFWHKEDARGGRLTTSAWRLISPLPSDDSSPPPTVAGLEDRQRGSQ